MSKKEDDKKVKTHFKGPGQWRSQAARLEGSDKKSDDKSDEK